MHNDSNKQIVITGHLAIIPRPPLPPRPHASYCYDVYDLAGGFEVIKKLVKSLFKKG